MPDRARRQHRAVALDRRARARRRRARRGRRRASGAHTLDARAAPPPPYVRIGDRAVVAGGSAPLPVRSRSRRRVSFTELVEEHPVTMSDPDEPAFLHRRARAPADAPACGDRRPAASPPMALAAQRWRATPRRATTRRRRSRSAATADAARRRAGFRPRSTSSTRPAASATATLGDGARGRWTSRSARAAARARSTRVYDLVLALPLPVGFHPSRGASRRRWAAGRARSRSSTRGETPCA